jgi:hypothetical protein
MVPRLFWVQLQLSLDPLQTDNQQGKARAWKIKDGAHGYKQVQYCFFFFRPPYYYLMKNLLTSIFALTKLPRKIRLLKDFYWLTV